MPLTCLLLHVKAVLLEHASECPLQVVNKRNDHGRREYGLAGLAAVEARDSIVFGCVVAWRGGMGDRGRREEGGCGYNAVEAVRRAGSRCMHGEG